MSLEQRRAFLTEGTRNAVVATIRAEGRPHAVPVWYVMDGDDVLIGTNEGTVKGQNLSRDPRVTVVVEDPAPPYSFVTIDGVAELVRDPEQIRRGATEIGTRYLGPEQAAGFVEYATGPGWFIARIRPEHVVAVARVSD